MYLKQTIRTHKKQISVVQPKNCALLVNILRHYFKYLYTYEVHMQKLQYHNVEFYKPKSRIYLFTNGLSTFPEVYLPPHGQQTVTFAFINKATKLSFCTILIT